MRHHAIRGTLGRASVLVLASTTVFLGCTERVTNPGEGLQSASLTFSQLAAGDRFFASPAGLDTAQGDSAHPWSLKTALNGNHVRNVADAGDTIFLRGGTYEDTFDADYLVGTSSLRIVVRGYPGERAIIDRNDASPSDESTLRIGETVSYVVFEDFEVTNSAEGREGDHATLNFRASSINNYASHVTFRRLVLYDGGIAFANDASASDVEIIGCVIFNNGWHHTDRGHGHGLYLKNNSTTQPVIARDNIIFNQFGSGIHVFSDASGELLNNIRLRGNVSFNNGKVILDDDDFASENILVGGSEDADADSVVDNFTYFAPTDTTLRNVRIGYETNVNGTVRVHGNYFVGGQPVVEVGYWGTASFSSNVLVGTRRMIWLNNASTTNQTWTSNTHRRSPTTNSWRRGAPAYGQFVPWRDSLGSSDAATSGLPSNNKEVVRYVGPGHINVIAYGWNASDDEVSVDLSLGGAFASGDSFVVRNAQNYFDTTPVGGRYTGTPITISLESVPAPDGVNLTPSPAPSTGSNLNVFLVLRVAGPPPPLFGNLVLHGPTPSGAQTHVVKAKQTCELYVSWTGGTYPVNFTLYQDDDSVAAIVNSTDTFYPWIAPFPDTTKFKVRGIDGNGDSAFSNVRNVVTNPSGATCIL